MSNAASPLLRKLLAEAVAVDTRPKTANDRLGHAADAGALGAATSSNITDAVAAVRHLLDIGKLSLEGYEEWIGLAFAFKHSFGEDGFGPWFDFSKEVPNFKSEEDCEKAWRGINEPKDGPRRTVGTYIHRAKEAGWKPTKGPRSGSDDLPDATARGLSKGTDPASHAIQLAEDAGDVLWVDQDGTPHVTYEATLPGGEKVSRHAAVRSETYRRVLQERFHRDVVSKALTNDQASLALDLLSFRAEESGVQHVAALRVGGDDRAIYVDLGRANGSVVEVTAEGWRWVDASPVHFVRGTRGELPDPERGGTLADFQQHFNVSPDDLLRTVGFLVGAFNVSGSYSILLTDGEQGSGKSTLNDKIVSLIDPPRTPKGARMAFNPKEQDLQIGALGVHVPYFDNVSSFSADAADALCRMSTGGGTGARTLYTNTGFTEINVIRPIVVTSIGAPTSRPDLLSRSVQITALPLDGKRRTERRVMAAFEADRPKLLGYLLDCVSAALRNREMVEEAVEEGAIDLPRMADFAEWVEGAHAVLGLPLGGFSQLLREGQQTMQTEAVLGTPVGAALVSYFSKPGAVPLNARASEVLSALRYHVPANGQLPAPNMLGKALNRLSVGLRALGIEYEVMAAAGRDNVQTYRLYATDAFTPVGTDELTALDDGGGHF